jgi:hypothetical protein
MQEFKGLGCTVKVIAASVSEGGKPIYTFQLRYWRAIHSELMTHRDFSRNASSSRAIPVQKMIDQVRNDPAGPIFWGSNQPGMQAGAELTGDELAGAKSYWKTSAFSAADYATRLMDLGLHKQVANRVLEPYQWISVIVTATEWDNWFELRDHNDAQPEIRDLARTMGIAMKASVPVVRGHKRDDPLNWHLPYVQVRERDLFRLDLLQAISAARCARVSYLTHDGAEPSAEKDLALYEKLVGGVPLHASPVEHQAVPATHPKDRCKNFVGWHQYRANVEINAFGGSRFKLNAL